MRKYIFLVAAIALAAAAAYASAPVITGTTVLTDTSYTGPYNVRTVITSSDGVEWPCLAFQFNPVQTGNTNPGLWYYSGWGDPNDNWVEEFVQVGDTFYFELPQIPQGLETPVEVAYVIFAYNADGTYSEWSYDPPEGEGYFSFMNLRYTPTFSNVSTLKDTFFTGPYPVKANITTLYGDSVANDEIYGDITGGAAYPRDSMGVDGFFYYSIPRHGGNSKTPLEVNWFLTAYDTMGNWTQYPLKRDTMNHFILFDPWSYAPHRISNTSDLGPFPVWVSFKSEGAITNDSLWIYDFGSSVWNSYQRDSSAGDVYYYTIPQQNLPVVNPVQVTWTIKATDGMTGNYSYEPSTAPTTCNTFRIFDWTPPQVSNMTIWRDTSYCGPFAITVEVSDTSGVSQVRLNYRAKPSSTGDTTWNYLPMTATGNTNEYKASIPPQYPGTMIQYYVSGKDGALDAAGQPLWNTGYCPAGGEETPWQFFAGETEHKILLVNDALESNDYGHYYLSAMDTTGVVFGYWDNRKQSVLGLLSNFNVLIWFTGDDSLTTLTQEERDSLSAFLDRGGNLLLSSKNLGQNVTDTAVFYNSYLKADFDVSNVATANINSAGQVAFPISHGTADTLYIFTVGTAGNYKSIDRMFPLAGAESVFQFKTIGGSSVIRCSTAVYKTVFTSVPLEAISSNSPGKLTRTEFIARVLRWFGIPAFYKVEGEPDGLVYSKSVILNQASPNPFIVNTSISYSIPEASKVSLKVYNVLGQEIATLFEGNQLPGSYGATWNGKDNKGNKVSNGIYLYRLDAGKQSITKKMVMVR